MPEGLLPPLMSPLPRTRIWTKVVAFLKPSAAMASIPLFAMNVSTRSFIGDPTTTGETTGATSCPAFGVGATIGAAFGVGHVQRRHSWRDILANLGLIG